jgi:hypothetical protein
LENFNPLLLLLTKLFPNVFIALQKHFKMYAYFVGSSGTVVSDIFTKEAQAVKKYCKENTLKSCSIYVLSLHAENYAVKLSNYHNEQ